MFPNLFCKSRTRTYKYPYLPLEEEDIVKEGGYDKMNYVAWFFMCCCKW